MNWGLTIVVGAVLGVCVGMTGTGGAFIIPSLIYIFGMSQLRAQGTALLIAASPVWFVPLIPYWRSNHVDWKLGLLLAIGLGVGSYFGARWAQTLSDTTSRRIFALVLFALAVRMFFKR